MESLVFASEEGVENLVLRLALWADGVKHIMVKIRRAPDL
jgi:hypothetical protein